VTNLVGDYTLTKNETWSGTVNIAGNVKVPDGITLKVKPGTVVNVKPNATRYRISIEQFAKLIVKGTEQKLITFKSSAEKPTNLDWFGIQIVGKLEAQYCIFANAEYGIFSVQLSDSYVKNCLFQNNQVSLSQGGFKNVNFSIENCTFKNSYAIFILTNFLVSRISNCNFIGQLDDLVIGESSHNVNISQSNFSNKINTTYYNVHVIENKEYVSNIIKADNCFNLKNVSPLKYGNVFEQSNPSGTKIANAGCGFEDKFTQFINNTSSKISIEDKRAILKEQMDQLKAKYLQK
jgi:hypothetical protein